MPLSRAKPGNPASNLYTTDINERYACLVAAECVVFILALPASSDEYDHGKTVGEDVYELSHGEVLFGPLEDSMTRHTSWPTTRYGHGLDRSGCTTPNVLHGDAMVPAFAPTGGYIYHRCAPVYIKSTSTKCDSGAVPFTRSSDALKYSTVSVFSQYQDLARPMALLHCTMCCDEARKLCLSRVKQKTKRKRTKPYAVASTQASVCRLILDVTVECASGRVSVMIGCMSRQRLAGMELLRPNRKREESSGNPLSIEMFTEWSNQSTFCSHCSGFILLIGNTLDHHICPQ